MLEAWLPSNGCTYCTRSVAEDLVNNDVWDEGDVVIVHEDETDGAVCHMEGEVGADGVVAAGHREEVNAIGACQIGHGLSRQKRNHRAHLCEATFVVLQVGVECDRVHPGERAHKEVGIVAARLSVGPKNSTKASSAPILSNHYELRKEIGLMINSIEWYGKASG